MIIRKSFPAVGTAATIAAYAAGGLIAFLVTTIVVLVAAFAIGWWSES